MLTSIVKRLPIILLNQFDDVEEDLAIIEGLR